jgi:pimeloyl-ACP methyl ester carboxylesterase
MQIPNPLKPRPKGTRKKSVAEKLREQELALKLGKPIETEVRHGYFKSFDGTRLFYSIEGTGTPVVFCYGLVCSSLHWTYQIEHFSKTHQAIWFDYRGHQNSDLPENMESLTLENMAKDLECLLNELKIEKAILLGHSMGVNVVLEFYKNNPDRVEAMVLANGTPCRPLETLFGSNVTKAGFSFLTEMYRLSPSLVKTAWKLNRGNPLSRTFIALGGFNPHLTPPEDVQLYVDQVTDLDPGILVRLINNYDDYDATSWLHQVKVPTLILAGEEDRIIPPEQQELMHQLIPGSQLEVLAHGSHCPQMDLPELVNLKIENFISNLK